MEERRPDERLDEGHQPRPAGAQPRSRSYQGLIEERIAAAQADGLFDNLPGAGQPLVLDDDALVPPEERAAYRLLKNAGYGLPWMELRKTIVQERQELEIWHRREAARWPELGPDSRVRLRAELEQRIGALNRLITSYNFMIPPAIGQLPLLQKEGYNL